MLTSRESSAFPTPTRNFGFRRESGRFRIFTAVGITAALVLVAMLNPQAENVYASNMFGALRAPGDPALIAGHRGDRSAAPENTLPALKRALDSPMEFVETDVQLSADGVPVLIHDDTVDRTTNGTGAVAELSYAQLAALDAGSWFDPSFAGTRIPTLDEFLAIFAVSEKKAFLELKGFWTADEVSGVRDLIHVHGVQNRIILASFDFTTLANAQTVAAGIPRVIIRRELTGDPVALASMYGAIAIITTPASVERDKNLVTAMHEAGLGVLLYTLNSKGRWSDALAHGVDGIITDRPSRLDAWLADTAPGT